MNQPEVCDCGHPFEAHTRHLDAGDYTAEDACTLCRCAAYDDEQ